MKPIHLKQLSHSVLKLSLWVCLVAPALSGAADIVVGSVMSQKGPASGSSLAFLKGGHDDHVW